MPYCIENCTDDTDLRRESRENKSMDDNECQNIVVEVEVNVA